MSKKSVHTISNQLTLSVEDSPAKTCPLPEKGQAWMEKDLGSGLNFSELYKSFLQNGCLSKTSPAFYPLTEDSISSSSFKGWRNSGIMCPGESLTLNISEFPKDVAVCSLSEALETDAAPKYFLSPRAAAGILRRAENRGKELPEMLRQALAHPAEEQAEQEKVEDKIQ